MFSCFPSLAKRRQRRCSSELYYSVGFEGGAAEKMTPDKLRIPGENDSIDSSSRSLEIGDVVESFIEGRRGNGQWYRGVVVKTPAKTTAEVLAPAA